MPEKQPKTMKERQESLDVAVDEIVRVKNRLVSKGFSEQQALEMARAILPMGVCSTGNQCAVST